MKLKAVKIEHREQTEYRPQSLLDPNFRYGPTNWARVRVVQDAGGYTAVFAFDTAVDRRPGVVHGGVDLARDVVPLAQVGHGAETCGLQRGDPGPMVGQRIERGRVRHGSDLGLDERVGVHERSAEPRREAGGEAGIAADGSCAHCATRSRQRRRVVCAPSRPSQVRFTWVR